MGRKSKAKGYGYEREVVLAFRDAGFEADRCFLSDGRSRGLPEDVDVFVKDGDTLIPFQCKRRASIANYLQPSDNNVAQVVREDRSGSLVVLTMETFIRVMKVLGEEGRLTEALMNGHAD